MGRFLDLQGVFSWGGKFTPPIRNRVKREDPFVDVYAANEDTFIHIRQLIYRNNGDQSAPKQIHDGVMMTLMQFRSLMFHLRALRASYAGYGNSVGKYMQHRVSKQ